MILKWFFDKIMALTGLILLSPILIIVALLIKIKMPGPILFKQQRVGKDAQLFTVYKFRSMTVKKEAATASRNSNATSIASEEQCRITPLGEKLRRYKLDELPELWNVLKGEMSFVGPRPDVPGYADQLEGIEREILKLKPGITGPASLKFRNEEDILSTVSQQLNGTTPSIQIDIPNYITSVEDYNDKIIYPHKIKLNLYYKQHYSFLKDIQMIICTVLGKKMEYAGEII
ncbi:sugar transferase [Prevotella ihumii]|uniref:sugar transferase n=1 Tax=Prevotella ihumii TaxID=1917878 RepID=UPI000981FBC7|nr:sugar transferase [Prevotella ihumii]